MKTPLVPWEAKFIRSHSVLFGGYLWRFEQEFALSTNERTQPGEALCLLLVVVLMYLVHSMIESLKQANCCRLGLRCAVRVHVEGVFEWRHQR